MRFFTALLGVVAGWLLGSTFAPAPPLPPTRWPSSVLLESYQRAEDSLRLDLQAALEADPTLQRARSPFDLAAGSAIDAKFFYRRGLLTGIYQAPNVAPNAGALKIEFACPGTGTGCCTRYSGRTSGRDYTYRNWSYQLPDRGYLNPRGNVVVAPEAEITFEHGLPFAAPLIEIPLHGEKHTPLRAYDPDSRAYKYFGELKWDEEPFRELCHES
jgi:hypothetical protein